MVRRRHIAEEYLSHNLDEPCLVILAPFLPIWGGTIPWALRFFVVREIDCENWLARGYMPAHQHCELFYPQVGPGHLLGSAIH